MYLYLVGILLFVILLVSLFATGGNKRHALYQKRARKIWRKLSGGKLSGGQLLVYLRRINPYVFEELVLDGFSKNGFSVRRNKRYSGDGGLDGRVIYEGKEYLIQCKRYRSYINPQHVRDFAALCDKRNHDGYFVHTGITGKRSRNEVYGSRVKIISGQKLLKLLCLV